MVLKNGFKPNQILHLRYVDMSSSISSRSRPVMKKTAKKTLDRAVHACTLDGSLFSSSHSTTARQFLDEIRPVLVNSSGRSSHYYILVDQHGVRVPDNGVLKTGMNGVRVRYTVLGQSCMPILARAYAEYRESVHFFNPDTATVHDLFPASFNKYERLYGASPPAWREPEDDEENDERIHTFRSAVESFEQKMLDLNPLADDDEESSLDQKIDEAWDLFVEMYNAFHQCDWNCADFA